MDSHFSTFARWFGSRILVWVVAVSTPSACMRCLAGEDTLPTPPQSNVSSDRAEPSPGPSLQGRGKTRADAPQFKARSNMPPGMQSYMQYGGGVFEESYFRGLQQPMQSQIQLGRIPRATGGYDYGFPMQSYRWGYFGAEASNPRMIWHRGYYGDKVRTTYRYGY